MNLARSTNERHLYPLLDFIRYLSYQGRDNSSPTPDLANSDGNDPVVRLPRRFNGSSDGLKHAVCASSPWATQPSLGSSPARLAASLNPTASDAPPLPTDKPSSSSSLPPDGDSDIPRAGSHENGEEILIDEANSASDSTDQRAQDQDAESSDGVDDSASSVSSIGVDPFLLRMRKRPRYEVNETMTADTERLDCAVVTGFHKGVANTRYLDIPLSEFGGELLISSSKLRRAEGQKLLGHTCCFLLLGSSLVVTGTIVDTGVDNVQVLPSGHRDLPLRWVDLSSVYRVPSNLQQFQDAVTKAYNAAALEQLGPASRPRVTD